MRNIFLTAVIITTISQAFAGDTLTVAQVYNFTVGDTFDYRYYSYQFTPPGQYATTLSYTRYVILDIFWSSDSSTVYIVRNKLYPYSAGVDTSSLYFYNNYAVDNLPSGGCVSSINVSTQPYFGATTNYLDWGACEGRAGGHYIFANSLGIAVNWFNSSIEPGSYYEDSTVLIFYSGHLGTFGTPYWFYPTSISSPTASNKGINVFPTISNGSFAVSIPPAISERVDFLIYNVTGQKITERELESGSNNVNLQVVSPGMYIWKAVSKNGYTQTGKIIIK